MRRVCVCRTDSSRGSCRLYHTESLHTSKVASRVGSGRSLRRLLGILLRQDVRDVVPRVAVQALLQSLLIQIMSCGPSQSERERERRENNQTGNGTARLMDRPAQKRGTTPFSRNLCHVPIKPVQRPRTNRPLMVPISMYSCASSL